MEEKDAIGYKILKPILKPLFLFWYNPKIIGSENIPKSGPTVICGNHLHAFDPCLVVISTKRMVHYMAKKEYHEKGFLKWFHRFIGTIPVDRERKDPICKKRALNVLNTGRVIGIFPEGTRNRTKKLLLPFKFGAISLAAKTKAYIVPFAITGDYKFRSKNLTIKFDKPFIPTDNLKKENEKLYKKIEKLLKELKTN